MSERQMVLAVFEDHWPMVTIGPGGTCSGSCVCGWDPTKTLVDWYQHLVNAVEDALGLEPVSSLEAEKELASWRRRAEYAEAVTKRICTCPWGPNDGPRLSHAQGCPVHAPLSNRPVE